MPRICSVCASSSRDEIDSALVTRGETYRGISRRYALTDDAISRHAANHLAPELRKRADLTEASRLDGYIASLEGLERQAERRGNDAEEKGDIRTALVAQHEQRETLLARAKLLGVGARETIDLQVSEVHRFEPDATFMAHVVQNLSELKLPEAETPILLDMPKTLDEATTSDNDLAEDSDIEEYDAASGVVRPVTPPPGLGVVKLPDRDGSRWDWGR